jgi:hypothetical protein
LAELRSGDPDRAIDDYISHDRIHQGATDDAVRTRLVDAWMNARVEGENVLMVAARLADVDDLNRRARYVLWDEYYLGNDEVVLAGRPFAESDEVLALRNDYQLGVLNGTRATVDRCFVLADDTLSREHAYTALSRGRYGSDLFVVAEDRRVEERHVPEVDVDPLDAVRRALGRSAGKHMAVDDVGPEVAPLEKLRRERNDLRSRIGDGHPTRRGVPPPSEALAGERHGREGA